jgi:hypothetical protein
MPVDYSKSKIYKLTTIHDPELVYYGSTVNPLYKRKQVHKFWSNTNKYTSSKLFELGMDNVEITLVENVNCNNKEELYKRERFYIDNNICVNKNIPGRTKKEHYEDNKDKILEKNKEYRELNKDKIAENKKEYYEDNKDKLLEKQKEYAELNKDKIKEYKKAYDELNNEKIKEYKNAYAELNKDKKKVYMKAYYLKKKAISPKAEL